MKPWNTAGACMLALSLGLMNVSALAIEDLSDSPPEVAVALMTVNASKHIDYQYDWSQKTGMSVVGESEPRSGERVTEDEADALIDKGEPAIQSRICMDCHIAFGNGAYYGPDQTKPWLDSARKKIFMTITGEKTREGPIVALLTNPDKHPTWNCRMPDQRLTEEEAQAAVAYLKWLASINTNGFPADFK